MNGYQQKVVQTIARHFGIPRKIYTPVVSSSLAQHNQIYFELYKLESESISIPTEIKYKKIYSSKEKEVSITKLWNLNKLKQTLLYANYNDIASNDPEDTLFCYVHGADVFVMYNASEYNGLGGIFTKENTDSREGIVIELLKNYLENNFKREECC